MRKRKAEPIRKRRPGPRQTRARRLAAQHPLFGNLYLEGYKAGIKEGVDIGIAEFRKALLHERGRS